MIYVTADSHWNHSNIIKYCDRPFNNITEMNEYLIKKWNEVVGPKDTVYHLGDFAMGKNPDKFFYRLNGSQKFLIAGNHDKKETLNLPWTRVYGKKREYVTLVLNINNQEIAVSHFAGKVWDQSHRNAWLLYGHSHATLPEDSRLSFDAGVDAWDFMPISLDIITRKMQWKLKNGAPPIKQYTPEAVREFNRQFL